MLSNIPGTRQVFERWMAWEPDEKAWSAYIKMEVRYNEFDRASKIFERLVSCHPEAKVSLSLRVPSTRGGGTDNLLRLNRCL